MGGGEAVKIRPAHHALLSYAEWCCDNRRPWPFLPDVAADLARNLSDIQTAMRELIQWGLVSLRRDEGRHYILRLGDGRETVSLARALCPVPAMVIPVVHMRAGPLDLIKSGYDDARIAA